MSRVEIGIWPCVACRHNAVVELLVVNEAVAVGVDGVKELEEIETRALGRRGGEGGRIVVVNKTGRVQGKLENESKGWPPPPPPLSILTSRQSSSGTLRLNLRMALMNSSLDM